RWLRRGLETLSAKWRTRHIKPGPMQRLFGTSTRRFRMVIFAYGRVHTCTIAPLVTWSTERSTRNIRKRRPPSYERTSLLSGTFFVITFAVAIDPESSTESTTGVCGHRKHLQTTSLLY